MNRDRIELLDQYLDGLLTADQRQEFEHQLESDPELRAMLERQSRIDDGLLRGFAPPAFDARMLETRLPTPSSNGKHHAATTLTLKPKPRYIRWGIAAAILLLVGIAAAIHFSTRPPAQPDYPELAWRSAEMVYRIEVQKGMRPLWVCKDDQEFATTFWKTLGQAVVVKNTPAYIANIGLSYSNTLSPKTVVHLARVRETPVVVLVDHVSNDTAFALSPESGLRKYRSQIGNLVFYEISPLPQPEVLSLFQAIDMPEAWK